MLTETHRKNWAGQHSELFYWTFYGQFKSKMSLPPEKVSKIPRGALTIHRFPASVTHMLIYFSSPGEFSRLLLHDSIFPYFENFKFIQFIYLNTLLIKDLQLMDSSYSKVCSYEPCYQDVLSTYDLTSYTN